jgi:hypothetical protein
MKPPESPVSPARERAQISSGVSGQIHPLEFDQRPRRLAERAARRLAFRHRTRRPPATTKRMKSRGAQHGVGQDAMGHSGTVPDPRPPGFEFARAIAGQRRARASRTT